MEDKKLNEVTTVNSGTLANVKTFLAVMQDGTIQQMSKEDLASVMSGLVGAATISKNGLMPAYMAIDTAYTEGKPIKYSLTNNLGFSFMVSVFKNHEIGGNSIVAISGYSGGIVASAIRKGGWLSSISYVSKSDGIDVYIKLSSYVFVSVACSGSSRSIFLSSPGTLVDEVPSDAVEVSF